MLQYFALLMKNKDIIKKISDIINIENFICLKDPWEKCVFNGKYSKNYNKQLQMN